MSADPFISRTDLGEYLGLDLSTDDKALVCVDAACDILRSITQQVFNQTADDEIVVYGNSSQALVLPQRPVTAVSSVTIDGADVTDFRFTRSGILYRTGVYYRSWPSLKPITVTYTHGYDLADFPRDLRMVALNLAARLYQQNGMNQMTVGSFSGTWAVPDAVGISKNEEFIVHKYR